MSTPPADPDLAAEVFDAAWEIAERKAAGNPRALSPRERVADVFEDLGLGDFEPEMIIEASVRTGGRKVSDDLALAAADFDAAFYPVYKVEHGGGDLVADELAAKLTPAVYNKVRAVLPLVARMMNDARRRQAEQAEQAPDDAPGPRPAPCEAHVHVHPQGRAPRLRSNHRTRGTRRLTRAGPSSGDDPPGESDSPPPRLRLWRPPHFGSCSPNLLRILLAGAAI